MANFESLPDRVDLLNKKVDRLLNLFDEKFSDQKKAEHDRIFMGEVCGITGYAKSNIYRLTSKNLIPYDKPQGSNKLTFSRKKILAWLESGRAETPDEYSKRKQSELLTSHRED